jgi:hypothetical protein
MGFPPSSAPRDYPQRTGVKLMASPMSCDDTMIVPRRAACRHESESMIQTLRSLTEEEHRKCLVRENAWAGER